MAQFRKKPVVIEAWSVRDLIRYFSKEWKNLPTPVEQAYEQGGIVVMADRLHINTLEGIMDAMPDDMLICGVKGELYPCKPDIFAATYEAA
jgi:hypothetical protein